MLGGAVTGADAALPDLRRVTFRPLTGRQVLDLIPGYHPIYRGVADELIAFVDEHFGHGKFRNWASFTHSAQALCRQANRERVNEEVARNVFALHGGGGASR